MKLVDKYLMFRDLPETPEVVIDSVVKLYTGKKLTNKYIAIMATEETGFHVTPTLVRDICASARTNCGVKKWSEVKEELPLGVMRFFKNGKKFKEVRMS